MRRGPGPMALPPPAHSEDTRGSRGRQRTTRLSVRARRVVRGPLRSFGYRHSYRFAVFGVCAALTGWSWWTAQASGYVGLSVNMLGQIIGDLLLMGLVAPLTRRGRVGRGGTEAEATPEPAALLATAFQIQLLDVGFCLPQLAGMSRYRTGAGVIGRQDEIVGLLRTALENDARIEILLPDPGTSAGHDAARRYGVDPDNYRKALMHLLHELGTVSGVGDSGGLDVRLYAEPAHVSVIRCDGQIWTSLHLDGSTDTPAYLALDQGSENARALQSYLNRLYATARSISSVLGGNPDEAFEITSARACTGDRADAWSVPRAGTK